MEGGPSGFTRASTGLALLENSSRRDADFAYGTITRSGPAFQKVRLPASFVTPSGLRRPPRGSHDPLRTTAAALHAEGLGSCAFARRYLRSRWLSFLSSGYLDVSVPPVASCGPMCSVRRDPPLRGPGCPIRVPADQLARQLPAAFRRLATPFFGSHRLGIHRAPLLAWPVLGPAVHEAHIEVSS